MSELKPCLFCGGQDVHNAEDHDFCQTCKRIPRDECMRWFMLWYRDTHGCLPGLDAGNDLQAGDDRKLFRPYQSAWNSRSPEREIVDATQCLKDLYAMVQGECPSLLEDHHLDLKIREVLDVVNSTNEPVRSKLYL